MGILRGIIKGIRSILLPLPPPETEATTAIHPLYRYGMLVFILVLFVLHIKIHLTLPPSYTGDPYIGYVVVLMLLFGHLACAFKWPKGIAHALWTLSSIWIVFALFYILYLSHALYPSTPSLLPWLN